MNLLISKSQDPYFNLATEEYLLKHSTEDFIFLYVNQPCVVVGKHQNTPKEINSKYIFENNILIARRLSGGGTVYHDEGNLNFSFIQSTKYGDNINYQDITLPIFDFLKGIFPNLIISKRNDFQLEGKKVSGSALHIYKNRVLAHGTLLIDCILANLSAALQNHVSRYNDKAIASVKAQVQNLSSPINILTANSLIANITEHLLVNYGAAHYGLAAYAYQEIQELASTKYAIQDWIFGYSPKYKYSNNFNFENNHISYALEVAKGVIETINYESKNELSHSNILVMNSLIGFNHNIFALSEEFHEKNKDDFSKAFYDSLF